MNAAVSPLWDIKDFPPHSIPFVLVREEPETADQSITASKSACPSLFMTRESDLRPLTVCSPLQGEKAHRLGHRHLLAHVRGAARGGFGERPAHHTQLCKSKQSDPRLGGAAAEALMGCLSLAFR